MDCASIAVLAAMTAGTNPAADAGGGAPQAAADQASPTRPETGPRDVQIYDDAWFEAFNALTALDMVSRIPGFSIDGGGDARGLGGSAGNVLLDGERPSSKSGLSGLLARIPASRVARVEVIRGAGRGVDMAGHSELVNIVRKEGGQGSGAYEARLEAWTGAPVTASGEASYSGRAAGWAYTADIARGADYSRFYGDEVLRTPSGALIERRQEESKDNRRDLEAGLTARREIGPWSVRLNASGEISRYDGREPSLARDGAGAFTGLTLSRYDEESREFELGGDVERDLGEGLSLQLIGLKSRNQFEGLQRFERYDETGFQRETIQTFDDASGETVLRGLVNWTPGEGHAVQAGLEGAYNFLDSNVTLAVDSGGGPEIIDLPVSDTRVEEYRGEAFASWVWTAASGLTLEPGLKAEISRIEQSGDGANSRSFFYLKPALSATWDYADDRQLSLLVERDVGQLDFGDFVSSTSVNEGQTDLGNPELEPAKTWRTRAEWTRRFWTEGVLSLILRYDYIQDLQDLVPVRGEDGALFDTPGNLDLGRLLIGRVEASVPLDELGLDGARLEGYFELRDAHVDDPVTGRDRFISYRDDKLWQVEFRQDLPDAGWAYGFSYFKDGYEPVWRLDEKIVYRGDHGDLDLFVETTRFFGVTIRAAIDNIGNPEADRTRFLFDGPRDTGRLAAIETRNKFNGRHVSLAVRGTF